MTDEEKAEEYKKGMTDTLKSQRKLKMMMIDFFLVDFLLKEGRKNAEKENAEKENAELKAQIPQWHDLRKDPNDLPKENGEYWCK